MLEKMSESRIFSLHESSFPFCLDLEGTAKEISTSALSQLEKLVEDKLPTISNDTKVEDIEKPDFKLSEKRSVFPDMKAKVEAVFERPLGPLKVSLLDTFSLILFH
jgi:hypothetical protein